MFIGQTRWQIRHDIDSQSKGLVYSILTKYLHLCLSSAAVIFSVQLPFQIELRLSFLMHRKDHQKYYL